MEVRQSRSRNERQGGAYRTGEWKEGGGGFWLPVAPETYKRWDRGATVQRSPTFALNGCRGKKKKTSP